MRSTISSTWREECLAGGAHSQLRKLDPESCASQTAVRHCASRLGSTDRSIRRTSPAAGGGDHRAQPPFMDDDQSVAVEPASRKPEQPLAVIPAAQLLAQHLHRRAAIYGPKGCQVRGGDAEARAQMPPQQSRDDPNRLEHPSAHAQKADLQGESELQLRSSAFLDDPVLVGREPEKHLDLEGRDFARQVSQTENVECPLSIAPSPRRHDRPRQTAVNKSLNSPPNYP